MHALLPIITLVLLASSLSLGDTSSSLPFTCDGLRLGYYCSSDSTMYQWCYGRSAPTVATCTAPLVCKCGFTTDNPCVWPSSTPSTCDGTPGQFMADPQAEPIPASDESTPGGEAGATTTPERVAGQFAVRSSDHVPLVIRLDKSKWQTQLRDLFALPTYDSAAAYRAESAASYGCSLHPSPRYDQQPTQLWIGRPTGSTTISNTPVTLRLPDKFFGLMLAYAMDHYGYNPAMMMGLAAKESFLSAIYPEDAGTNPFIVPSANGHYDCYAANKRGLCTDNNLDGPFQVETGGMSSDVAVFPQRFYTTSSPTAPTSSATPIGQRTPTYTTDNEIMNAPSFRAFHDAYTLHLGRAVVLSSLDLHFRHTMLNTIKKIGFYDAMKRRAGDRAGQDALEFAAACFVYNRGIFDTGLTTVFNKCGATADPAVDCGLNGYGGHTTDIRAACKLLDGAADVYDYPVTMADVEWFIDTLQSTYPYLSVAGVVDPIDWTAIRTDAAAAFALLKDHRGSADGSISFRYDWRALVAVVRMHLPPREILMGPSLENYINYWGVKLTPVASPIQSPASFPVPFCSLAGGDKELCSPNSPPTGTEEGSSSSSEGGASCDTVKMRCLKKFAACRGNSSRTMCDCLQGSWLACIGSACQQPDVVAAVACACAATGLEDQSSSDQAGADQCAQKIAGCLAGFTECRAAQQLSACQCLSQWTQCATATGCMNARALSCPSLSC